MGTEVITYSRIGKEDIRFGKGTFEVVLADGRKVTLTEVDLGAIINNAELSSPAFPYWFNVQTYVINDYVPGTGGDDTQAIQMAFDDAVAAGAGTVIFPYTAAGYRVTGVSLAPTAGQVHINLLGLGGVGSGGVTITYTGSGGAAITITNNTRYSIKNLRVNNASTGVDGIAFTSLSAGSSHGPLYLENLLVSGFTNGYHFGTSGNLAASEIEMMNVEAQSNTVGLLTEGTSSINLRGIGINMTSNTTGVKFNNNTTRNDTVNRISGTSFSSNGTDIELAAPGWYHFQDLYSEGTGIVQLMTAAATGINELTNYVMIENWNGSIASPGANLIQWPGVYSFRNARMDGGITVGDPYNYNRYEIERMGQSPAITYAAGAHSLIFYHDSLRQTSDANNTTVADAGFGVYVDGGTQRPLFTFPWSGHPTTAIPTAVPQLDQGVLFPEITDPTGTANTGTLYVRDNGAGKSQLCVIFGTGTVQVIATEP